MDKTKAVLLTLVLTLIFCGWLANSSIQGHLRTIGLLRSSIVEARQLLESPIKDLDAKAVNHPAWLTDSTISRGSLQEIKKEIENAQMILENAQNSLEGNGEEDYSTYDPYFN